MTTAEISAKRREAMAVARFDTLLNETTMALALAATTPSALAEGVYRDYADRAARRFLATVTPCRP